MVIELRHPWRCLMVIWGSSAPLMHFNGKLCLFAYICLLLNTSTSCSNLVKEQFALLCVKRAFMDQLPKEMDTKIKRRVIIEFLITEECSAAATRRRFEKVYGEDANDVSNIRTRTKWFQNRETNMQDKSRSGRPATAVMEETQCSGRHDAVFFSEHHTFGI